MRYKVDKSISQSLLDVVWKKMDSDFSKLITPQQIAEFEKSNMAVEAIKLIGAGMEDRLSQITQTEYVSVRDFVITEIALNNASCSGAIANMTMAEYTGAKIVSNQNMVSVTQNKTMHCYGPAKICLSAMHFAWLKCYVSVFRPVVCHEDSDNVFLTWNGESTSSGQVSRAVQSAWSKAGIGNDITCTLTRKTAVSAVHQKMPQLKTDWQTWCVIELKRQRKATVWSNGKSQQPMRQCIWVACCEMSQWVFCCCPWQYWVTIYVTLSAALYIWKIGKYQTFF